MGPPRHYDERGPPPRHYDDRYAAPLDRYADRYGPPPPRHYDDRGPPPRHYDDRYGSSSSSSRGGSRYYEERSYDRRGGVDRYAGGGAERYYSVGDPYRDDRYSGSSTGQGGLAPPAHSTGIPGRGGITEAEAGAMRGHQDLHCLQDQLWLQDTERRMHSQEIDESHHGCTQVCWPIIKIYVCEIISRSLSQRFLSIIKHFYTQGVGN